MLNRKSSLFESENSLCISIHIELTNAVLDLIKIGFLDKNFIISGVGGFDMNSKSR